MKDSDLAGSRLAGPTIRPAISSPTILPAIFANIFFAK